MKMKFIGIKIESPRIEKFILQSLSILIILSLVGIQVILMPVGAQITDDTAVSIVSDASDLGDKSFRPNPINIKVGDTVTWTNYDSTHHTVTERNFDEPSKSISASTEKEKGPIVRIVDEIITNISYNLNNLIGNRENNSSPDFDDNSQLSSNSSESIDNVSSFNSGILETGDTFRFTFQEFGTYEYYCTIHPGMIGKVVVS